MTTRYQEIAAFVRDRIGDGTYPPGSKIPSIPTLMDEFGVARDTVRDAVARLTQEGLVTPLRGVGTVVRDSSPVALAYAPTKAARVWAAQTGEPDSDTVIETGWEQADPGIRERLGLPENSQVVHRVRHQRKGQQLAQIMEQWLPDHVVTSILNATGTDLADINDVPKTDLFSLIRESGGEPAEVTETVLARMPDPEESGTLELPPGVPVLITYRVTRDTQAQPVETSTFTGAADRMSQSFTVPLTR